MAKFERSRNRKRPRGSREGYSRNSSSGRKSFGRRGSSRFSGPRREIQRTKVTCSSCGKTCEVPFKPTSDKPVYCDDCFAKKGKTGPNTGSNKNFDIINEKLDKIMKALKI